MPFSNSILAGDGTLVRDHMRSEGFQTGVQGWQVTRDGDAEFNNVIIRGDFATGSPPDPRIEIPDGQNRIDLYSAATGESAPASIVNDNPGGPSSTLQITGSQINPGALTSPSIELRSDPDVIGTDFQDTGIEYQAGRHDFQGNIHGTLGNSSVMPTLTPVTAIDNNNDASAQTNSTAYVALVGSTGPQPNPFNAYSMLENGFAVPSGGRRFFMHVSCDMSPSNAGGIAITSFQIRDFDSTGAVLWAASDATAVLYQADAANGRANFGSTFYVGNLNPSSGILFFQMLHRVVAGATVGTFRRRRLTLIPAL